jgi:hypothetical protein
MNPIQPIAWRFDSAWSLVLVVLTVVIHVYGLGLINQSLVSLVKKKAERRHFTVGALALIMGPTVFLVTCLHAVESAAWAAAYVILGALPDFTSAMLYSLNAMTSYGHEGFDLQPRWQFMGGVESLNGWILFGLSTAFLYRMIQRAWPLVSE